MRVAGDWRFFAFLFVSGIWSFKWALQGGMGMLVVVAKMFSRIKRGWVDGYCRFFGFFFYFMMIFEVWNENLGTHSWELEGYIEDR